MKIEDLQTHEEVNLAAEQLAAYWNVEVQTVRKWVRERVLTGFRVGRALRVPRQAALRFQESQHLQST